MVEKKSEKLEREYVIPLREKCRPVPRYKKTNKAVKTVKEFLVRHMGIRDRDLKKIKIDKYLNETLWSNGIKNPPHKIKVKAVKDGENVIVTAAELSKKVEFKKAREEKREKTAKDFVEKKKTMMQKAQEAAKPVAKKTTEETEKETQKQRQGESFDRARKIGIQNLIKEREKEYNKLQNEIIPKIKNLSSKMGGGAFVKKRKDESDADYKERYKKARENHKHLSQAHQIAKDLRKKIEDIDKRIVHLQTQLKR